MRAATRAATQIAPHFPDRAPRPPSSYAAAASHFNGRALGSGRGCSHESMASTSATRATKSEPHTRMRPWSVALGRTVMQRLVPVRADRACDRRLAGASCAAAERPRRSCQLAWQMARRLLRSPSNTPRIAPTGTGHSALSAFSMNATPCSLCAWAWISGSNAGPSACAIASAGIATANAG